MTQRGLTMMLALLVLSGIGACTTTGSSDTTCSPYPAHVPADAAAFGDAYIDAPLGEDTCKQLCSTSTCWRTGVVEVTCLETTGCF